MKKFFIVLLLVLSASGLFAEEPKGQIFEFNEDANEEVIVVNNAGKEAFKIYIHTGEGTSVDVGVFSVDYTSTKEGWHFIAKTPILGNKERWKSSQDFKQLRKADYICIESKSGKKYNYNFQTKHDKLYITVSPHNVNDDW